MKFVDVEVSIGVFIDCDDELLLVIIFTNVMLDLDLLLLTTLILGTIFNLLLTLNLIK